MTVTIFTNTNAESDNTLYITTIRWLLVFWASVSLFRRTDSLIIITTTKILFSVLAILACVNVHFFHKLTQKSLWLFSDAFLFTIFFALPVRYVKLFQTPQTLKSSSVQNDMHSANATYELRLQRLNEIDVREKMMKKNVKCTTHVFRP